MIIRQSNWLASSVSFQDCPESKLPEFAFIGRSNVGKSSLINSLTRSKNLAKVSATPGKTKLLNFFTINQRWNLVDMPGYGYAKTGYKQRSAFAELITDYLEKRSNLCGTFILVDSRHKPQRIDLEFVYWMISAGRPFILLFTKIDKLSASAAQKNKDAFLSEVENFAEDTPHHVFTSAKLSKGRKEILDIISASLEEQGSVSSEIRSQA
ncbi:MAG: ribosome biogenesis GTP-binding protein YihA/YsxC [Chthoniobacterales bacterium]